MTSQPVNFAFPPDGSANVEPHTEQEIKVAALSKIVDSLPQSLQPTLRNLPLIFHTSLVNKLEFLRSLPFRRMGLPRLIASKNQVNPLGWFIPRGFRAWETTISRSHSSESSLAPFQLTSPSLLYALDRMESMLSSRRAISHNFPRHLHQKTSPLPSCAATHQWPVFELLVGN